MQGGRGGRDFPFNFGDPFAIGGRDSFFDFGDPFASLSGMGSQRSLLSGFFGGRDPFNDPFFTRPFGGISESNFFGPTGSPFMNMQPSGFLEPQAPEPDRPRGPIIEELNSEDEKEETDKEKKENPRKHGRSSSKPYVKEPDDEVEEKKSKLVQYRNDYNRLNATQSRPHTGGLTFQSSTVTYGGPNGAYYTSSRSRRIGSDGVTFEESKEADTATGQAKHFVARGLHDKGHAVARKLNSDGKVDTMQTLHNLNEDELAGFEEAWKVKAQRSMPGLSGSSIGYGNMGVGSSGQYGSASRGGWALPSTDRTQNSGRVMRDGRAQNSGRAMPDDRAQNSGRVIPDGREAGSSHADLSGRMKSDAGDRTSYSRGKGRN